MGISDTHCDRNSTVVDLLRQESEKLEQRWDCRWILPKRVNDRWNRIGPCWELQRKTRYRQRELDDDASWASMVCLERSEESIAKAG